MTASSYWQRGAGWSDRWIGAPVPGAVDFAIVGGGFAGLATAIRLRMQHPRASIALFEAERVGYGASGRNAGFLSPLPAPVWLVGAERSAEQAWGTARINREVHAAARWLGELVPGCELQPATLALQAQSRVSDVALGVLTRAVQHAGLPHHLADSRVRPGHRVLEMAGYTVHPYKLVRGLAEHAHGIGVAIHERTRVQKVEAIRAGGARVFLDGAIVEAGKVVVCTNAYTSSIDLGERLTAHVVHSFMVTTPPVDAGAVPRDGDFTVEVNMAQGYHRMHEGRIIYGAIDKFRMPAGDDFAVPAKERAALEKYLAKSFAGVPLPIDEAWSGRFHGTLAGLPIIKTSADNAALVFNVGYGGTGVALTLACATLAAGVASDGPFSDEEDTRLLALIHSTRISVRDAMRAITRLARGVAMPWTS